MIYMLYYVLYILNAIVYDNTQVSDTTHKHNHLSVDQMFSKSQITFLTLRFQISQIPSSYFELPQKSHKLKNYRKNVTFFTTH